MYGYPLNEPGADPTTQNAGEFAAGKIVPLMVRPSQDLGALLLAAVVYQLDYCGSAEILHRHYKGAASI